MTATTDFDTFWQAYPRKVGKLAAQKAYLKARTQATGPEILAGIAGYVANKPAYADYCHPATFLSQGRWMDEYTAPAAPTVDWFAECQRLHGSACGGQMRHHTRMILDEGRAKRVTG